MLPDDVVRLPAGWYPDPTGLPQLRWWDNHAWTQHTTAARQPLIVQESQLAWADDLPTRRERREREREDGSTVDPTLPTAQSLLELAPPSRDLEPFDEPAPDLSISSGRGSSGTDSPGAGFSGAGSSGIAIDADPEFEAEALEDAKAGAEAGAAYEPVSAAGHAGRGAHAPEAQPVSASRYQAASASVFPSFSPEPADEPTAAATVVGTVPAWLIALIPLLQLVATLLIVTGFGATIDLPLAIPGIAIGLYLLVIGLAIADRAILRRAGRRKPAHWTWALLTAPVYLVVRGMSLSRESGRGFGPALVWIVLALLQLGSVLAVPGLLISALPTAFSAQAAQSIMSDATAIGAKLSVVCPPTPPVLIGEHFGCKAVRGAGDTFEVTVSLQRVNGWINWRVDDWGVYTLSR
ncbi:MAG: DUF2510 domain-containing protein [Lacisediminihabitans sp.]